MNEPAYRNRQLLDMATWPQLREKFTEIVRLVMPAGELPSQLKWEIFTLNSLAGGCHHCQSHGAYGLHLMGVSTQRIRDIWQFERNGNFSTEEMAAFRLARDSGQVPNKVTGAHFVQLRQHYSDAQIVELLAVIGIAGWLNRWNDSIAVVTDAESVDWASEHLSDLGWNGDKHRGEPHEQRSGHPASKGTK